MLSATLGWLSLSYDRYDGDFRYLHLKGEYLVTDALGISFHSLFRKTKSALTWSFNLW